MLTETSRNESRRGALWCGLVFGLALPAITSPILLLPLSFNVPRWLGALLGPVLSHPKWWAAAATLVGVFGAKRFAQSDLQAAVAAILVLLAWWLGSDTAERMGSLF
jgi:hypothetical protein